MTISKFLFKRAYLSILLAALVALFMLQFLLVSEFSPNLKVVHSCLSRTSTVSAEYDQNIMTMDLNRDSTIHTHPDWKLVLDLDLDDLQLAEWDKPKVQIHVLTQNRLYSLKRLCDSLLDAKYVGSQVDLTFHVEANADKETIDYVNSFKWPHGDLRIHQRVVVGGLMAAVVESWYPLSDDEYAIMLEDDIEVSPLYFIWAKFSLLKYRYTESARRDSLVGISLYTARVQELTWPRQTLDPQSLLSEYSPNIPYLWQLPCSWGAIYFPEKWREFNHYLRARLHDYKYDMNLPQNVSNAFPDFPSTAYEVYVPDSRSNSWSKSWKKYFIELITLRGYVMLYPNFPNQTSFSTNHLEPGTHISPNSKVRQKIDQFRVPLVQMKALPYLNMRFPSLDQLPTLNPFGVETTMDGISQYRYSIVIHPKPKENPQEEPIQKS